MTDTKITPNDSNDLLKRLVYGARNQAEELAHKLKPFVLSAMFALSNVSAVPKTDIVKDNTNPYPKTDNVTKDFKNYVELPISGRLVIDDAKTIKDELEKGNVVFGDLEFSAEQLNKAENIPDSKMSAIADAYVALMPDMQEHYCLRAFKAACSKANKKEGVNFFENFSKEEKRVFYNTIGHAYEAKPFLDKMGFVEYKRADGRLISKIYEIRLFAKGKTESGHIEFTKYGVVYYDNEPHVRSPGKPYGELTCYTTKEIMNEVIAKDIEANPNEYKLFRNEDGTYFLAQGVKIPEEYQELYEQYKKEQEERKNSLNYEDYASNVMPFVGERIDNLRYKLYEASNGDVASATTVKQTPNATPTNSPKTTTRRGGRV